MRTPTKQSLLKCPFCGAWVDKETMTCERGHKVTSLVDEPLEDKK